MSTRLCIFHTPIIVSFTVLITVFVAGCKSDLPVQYLVCDSKKEKCSVTAQFKDPKSCEFFKTVSGSYCDKDSNPGLIICDTNRTSTKTTSMCVENLGSRGAKKE